MFTEERAENLRVYNYAAPVGHYCFLTNTRDFHGTRIAVKTAERFSELALPLNGLVLLSKYVSSRIQSTTRYSHTISVMIFNNG